MLNTILRGMRSLTLSLLCLLLGCSQSAPPPKPPAPASRAARAPQGPQQQAQQTPRADAAAQRVSTAASDPKIVEIAGIVMPKPPVWTWQAPTVQFRALQYSVPTSDAAGSAAELIFSVFASGDGGPIDANVKRWVSQFRTADGDEATAKIEDRQVGEIPVKMIELAGHYQGMGQAAPRPGIKQLSAIIQLPASTVFVRLIGSEATVESARSDFEAMIAGIKPQG